MNALPKPPKTLVPAMKDANNQELACGHLKPCGKRKPEW